MEKLKKDLTAANLFNAFFITLIEGERPKGKEMTPSQACSVALNASGEIIKSLIEAGPLQGPIDAYWRQELVELRSLHDYMAKAIIQKELNELQRLVDEGQELTPEEKEQFDLLMNKGYKLTPPNNGSDKKG